MFNLASNPTLNFLLGTFPVLLPTLFSWSVFALVAYPTVFKKTPLLSFKAVIGAVISFKIIFTALMTLGQYYIWSIDPMAKSFLAMPLDRAVPIGAAPFLSWLLGSDLGYFIFYSWGRFWLNLVLSLGAAYVFWTVLRALKKYRERFFDEGETELGLVCALIAGWPYIVVFVPLAFVAVALLSIIRGVFLKEAYTTMSYPFLLAILATLVFGAKITELLSLAVLRV